MSFENIDILKTDVTQVKIQNIIDENLADVKKKSIKDSRNAAWDDIMLSTYPSNKYEDATYNFLTVEECESAFSNRDINIVSEDHNGFTPVHYAIATGNLDVLHHLVSKKGDIHLPTSNENKDTTIHLSIDSGNVSMTHYLISNGVDPNQCNLIGQNALIYSALRNKYLHVAYFLHMDSIDKNAQDSDGNTALHYAVENGSIRIVKELLKYNVDLKRMNREGMTPLHIAARKGHALIADMILTKDITTYRALDNYRKTPADYALQDQDQRTISVFKEHRAIYRLPQFVQKYRYYTTPIMWVIILYLIFAYAPFYIKILSVIALIHSLYRLTVSDEFRYGRNPTISVAVTSFAFTCFLIFTINILPFSLHRLPLLSLSYGIFFFYLYCFYKASFTNAGTVIRKQIDIIRIYEDLVSGRDNMSNIYCSTCLLTRPERSKHCSQCNACILKMDHHCPWIDNCVGEKNHTWFYLTVISYTLLFWAYSIESYIYFFNQQSVIEAVGFFGKVSAINALCPGFVDTYIALGLFSIFTLGLSVQHTYFIGRNITNFENSYWRRYSYMIDENGNYFNRYDQGFINNFKNQFKMLFREEKDEDPHKIV